MFDGISRKYDSRVAWEASESKTGIFVIYFEVVRSIRGFEIGWYLLGTCFGYLPKTKKQVPVQKMVWGSIFFKIRHNKGKFGRRSRPKILKI